MSAHASGYTHATPVYVQIGTRERYQLGTVHANGEGRIHPQELARFFRAVSVHMQSTLERWQARQPRDPKSGA